MPTRSDGHNFRRIAGGVAASLGLALAGAAAPAAPAAFGVRTAFMDGPPPGYTGGFGEPNCQFCHAGAPLNNGAAELELIGIPPFYQPGKAYQLTVSLRRGDLARAGFQLAARYADGSSAGEPAGSLAALDDRVKVISGWEKGGMPIPYAVQSQLGSATAGAGTAGTARWRLTWTAPPAAGASVALNVAANAANDDNSEFGDHTHTGSWSSRSPRSPRSPQRKGWTLQFSGTESEFRGLSAASPEVVWAGARGGVYARTTDGGRNWSADTVPGATDLFFIDAHAVDSLTAYLLGTSFDGGRAAIYKTTDGGASWTEQYHSESPGVFFDGLAFWDAESGVAFSDPVDGAFLIVVTDDGGATWDRVAPENIPQPLPGEAGFAASGTAIAVQGMERAWIGTGGGSMARVLRTTDRGRTWSVAETPLPGGQTAGIFGIAFRDSLNGIAVGGDHTKRHEASRNIMRTEDGGITWSLVGSSAPAGVRYGVAYLQAGNFPMYVATGPSGWGYSLDEGSTWVAIDTLSVNTVTAAGAAGAAGAGAIWVAGVGSRVMIND